MSVPLAPVAVVWVLVAQPFAMHARKVLPVDRVLWGSFKTSRQCDVTAQRLGFGKDRLYACLPESEARRVYPDLFN